MPFVQCVRMEHQSHTEYSGGRAAILSVTVSPVTKASGSYLGYGIGTGLKRSLRIFLQDAECGIFLMRAEKLDVDIAEQEKTRSHKRLSISA